MLDYDLIETPENVELERPLAGIGSRFIAGLIDNLLLIGLYAILFILFLIAGAGSGITDSDLFELPMVVLAIIILMLFAIYWGYFVFFEMIMNGQTPGKRRMKIRVVKEGGGPITFSDVAIRNLLRPVDGFAIYGVAGVVMFITGKMQRLGDMAAGTVVVSEQSHDYSARSDKRVATKWESEVTAEALRATGLRPEEYSALRNYWVRRHQFTEEARRRVLPQLLRPILQRTGHQPANLPMKVLEDYVREIMRLATDAERENRGNNPHGAGNR